MINIFQRKIENQRKKDINRGERTRVRKKKKLIERKKGTQGLQNEVERERAK